MVAEIRRARSGSPTMYAADQISVKIFMTIRTSGSVITGRSTSEAMVRWPSED